MTKYIDIAKWQLPGMEGHWVGIMPMQILQEMAVLRVAAAAASLVVRASTC
jgi:hypothetical protein